MREGTAIIYLLGSTALDRRAYCTMLRHELDLSVEIESDFTPVRVWTAMRAEPDLALVVTDRAPAEVRDAIQMIPRLRKETRVLVVSASMDETVLKDWGRSSIHGYVVKDGDLEELRPAIDAVLSGNTYFSKGVRDAIQAGQQSADGFASLSPREAELLPLLARGLTLRDAATAMAVSYKTADSYRTSMLRKLGIHDRVELARYAIRERIIDP